MPAQAGRPHRPRVFISSALGPEGSEIRQARDDIHTWALSEGYDAFLFERARTRAEWDAMSPAMNERICLDNVDASDVFIGIFHNSYGGSHSLHLADVSFTDIEFFEAFRRNIPLKVYIYESLVAQPELMRLIQIVRTLVPDSVTRCRSLAALTKAIRRDLDAHFGKRKEPADRFGQFFRRLLAARQRHDDRQNGIRLLLDEYPPTAGPPSRDRIEHDLALVPTLDSYSAQLDATWQVFRRLFAVPWRTNQNQDWRDLWDRALSTWDRPAAWYGLHGFTLAGKLAANNTLLAVRALTASDGESDSLPELVRIGSHNTGAPEVWVKLFATGGLLASEYYSIAKLAPWSLKRKYFRKADEWCQVALRADARSLDLNRRSGITSIRGQILMEIGPRSEAVALMEESLRCRVEGGLGPSEVAWGEVELGYAYFRTGRVSEGQRMLERGAAAVEKTGSPGFVVRARKRLIAMHLQRGRILQGLREAREAMEIAVKHDLTDQIRDLKWLTKPFGALKR